MGLLQRACLEGKGDGAGGICDGEGGGWWMLKGICEGGGGGGMSRWVLEGEIDMDESRRDETSRREGTVGP